MSTVQNYEELKSNGSGVDRIKFLLSLADKTEIEQHLKSAAKQSYEHLEDWIFLSNLTKNQGNLLQIFEEETFPIKRRAQAALAWIGLQKEEEKIARFIVETINNANRPRAIKYAILKDLHRAISLKISPTFYSNLIGKLTEKNAHDSYNLDGHLLSHCSKEQIFSLLSSWSIERFEQIEPQSALFLKLLRFQPSIVLQLIGGDLQEKKCHAEKCYDYFRRHSSLLTSLSKKQPKELLELFITTLKQFPPSEKKLLPSVVQAEQKHLFDKAPEQMIELLTLIASANLSSPISYQTSWGGSDGYELGQFSFPASFAVENYLKLFFHLYEQCQWGTNHFDRLLTLMLTEKDSLKNLSALAKRRRWFDQIVVQERIGKEKFIEKLLKYGNETTLSVLEEFPHLTAPLAKSLLAKAQKKEVVKAQKEIQLIRYEVFSKDLFDRLFHLFKQISSDVNQREMFYPLLLQSALASHSELLDDVLQTIAKRFPNEQILVLDAFLQSLLGLNNRFYLEVLPKSLSHFRTIFNFAFDHLQCSDQTLQSLLRLATKLLEKTATHSNATDLRQFALELVKRCFDRNVFRLDSPTPKLLETLADLYLSDVFPKLISKSDLSQLASIIQTFPRQVQSFPKIDSFLQEFFTQTLPSSAKLQSILSPNDFLVLTRFYLGNPSTRLQRVKALLDLERGFFIQMNIQRIVVRSQQFRSFLDQLLADQKCLTIEKLTNEQSKFTSIAKQSRRESKSPGLEMQILQTSRRFLTVKEQDLISKIILNDYLQDKDVSNREKLKCLRVLRSFPSTYNQTLAYLRQNEQLITKNPNERGRKNRGAGAQPLDDILICLPATFDLNSSESFAHLQFLKEKLNSANAKFVSDAMLNLSRKLPDQVFLDDFLQFVQNENFATLGITANKEILRLLNQFRENAHLIDSVIEPFWEKKPHQDIRVCLVNVLLNFLGKSQLNKENEEIIFKILENAVEDEYLPVIQSLFPAPGAEQRWPLTLLRNSKAPLYERFVRKVQFLVLDHPTSLQARTQAWSLIDHQFVEIDSFIEKIDQLSLQFDKEGNTLAIIAFKALLALFKDQSLNSFEPFIALFKNVMSHRDPLDKEQNGVDRQHDLPVYHRIEQFLAELNREANQFTGEQKMQLRSLTPVVLQFDLTLAGHVTKILMKIAQNREDLANLLENLEKALPASYFQALLTQLSMVLAKEESCPFVHRLDLQEKLQLAQWFIEEKHRPIFVFEFLKESVFNQKNIDPQIGQSLVQQLRASEDLFLQQQAKHYTVPWNEDGNNNDDDGQMNMDDDDEDDYSSESSMD